MRANNIALIRKSSVPYEVHFLIKYTTAHEYQLY